MTAPNTYCNECGASNSLQATYCFACNNALQPIASSPILQVEAPSTSAAITASKVIGPLVPSYLLHSRYSIVSQIGTGGFGAVYQAKDTLFSHRLVAIKEMNQDGLSPRELAEATAAFEHEALLLSNLTHPNLPRIHDHFSENGRSYVVMDFIAGDTLEDYQDKVVQRLPVEMVLEIGMQLCSVLDYLHTHQPPIIFRDIKPANIMRTADNHVYLIDFGIARHFKPGKAKDTIPLGSKGYAAPEQYGKAQTTPQTDIYGLGATLHQLLTGDDPSLALFHFKPVQAGKRRLLPIATRLNTLLKQMLEMEMSKRPASIAIVKQELQGLLAQQTAHSISTGQKVSQTPFNRRRFLIGLGSMVATCGLSCAIATFVVEKPNLVDTLFAHPFSGTTPILSSSPAVPAQATIRSRSLYTYRKHLGTVTAVAWSPNGQHIASAGTIDSSVQVWDANTGSLVFIPRKGVFAVFATNPRRVDALAWSSDSIHIAAALAWSSDSIHIAAALGNDTVDVWSIETGQSFFLFGQSGNVSQPGDPNALAWSPDGSKIAAVTRSFADSENTTLSENTAVQVRSVTTQKISIIYTGQTQEVFTLAWSPDGQYIASGGADGMVQVWNATTGHTSMTYSWHFAPVYAVAWSPDSKQIASGGADGTVQVWDAATGRTLFTYRGHSGVVNTVAWQQGPLLSAGAGMEARIASGGADATVQVWSFGMIGDTKHLQAMALQGELLIYRGHSGPVTSVTWAPDGQLIASGSEDGTVQVWQAM